MVVVYVYVYVLGLYSSTWPIMIYPA